MTAIFDSSLKTERSLKAEMIAADPEKDLAILGGAFDKEFKDTAPKGGF